MVVGPGVRKALLLCLIVEIAASKWLLIDTNGTMGDTDMEGDKADDTTDTADTVLQRQFLFPMYPGGHDDYNDYEINCGQMTCDCTAEFEQRRRKKRQISACCHCGQTSA